MTTPQTQTPPAPVTPGDDALPLSKASHPTKGRRFRVLGEGEGDYCIYEITPKGSPLPAGTLVPIPGIPRFEALAPMKKWMANEAGDLLAGKQVMLLCAYDIATIAATTKTVLSINFKPKVQVTGPETVTSGG